VVKKLLATDQAWKASRMVSAVQFLPSTHTPIGQEEGSLGDRLVTAVKVTASDTVGDGLSGQTDNDVFPLDDEQ
jgi:hypothetical protein